MKVIVERSRPENESHLMLIRVAGLGRGRCMTVSEQDSLCNEIESADGIDGIETSRAYIGVMKHMEVDWEKISPSITEILRKFYGEDVEITERLFDDMGERYDRLLGDPYI